MGRSLVRFPGFGQFSLKGVYALTKPKGYNEQKKESLVLFPVTKIKYTTRNVEIYEKTPVKWTYNLSKWPTFIQELPIFPENPPVPPESGDSNDSIPTVTRVIGVEYATPYVKIEPCKNTQIASIITQYGQL